MNVIIPIGGVGQRFQDEGYLMPKPLINVLGKPMIYRVIDNLNLSETDNVYIIYNNQLKEYNFEDLIKFYFPKKNIYFVSLDFLTKGAAETVLTGLNELPVKELNKEFLIMDCDTFYNEDVIGLYKQSKNKNLIYYFNDENPNPIFSYIKVNTDRQVVAIKEKEKISHNANTGAYGFKSGHLLKQYCENILNLNSELYISYVYKKMLEDKIKVYGQILNSFNCVGTPLQLQIYCNKHKTNSESLRICFDLDNTLVSYPKTPGNYSSVEPINKNINFLKLLKELGHTIIVYTARRMKTHNGNVGAVTSDIGRVTFDTLDKFGIPYDEIYFGKPYAHFYIDDLAVNPYISLDKSLGIFSTDTQPRDFHQVEYDNDKVIKTTSNVGEIYYYQNIPDKVKYLFPKIYNIKENKITLENIEGVNFSYLYTNKLLKVEDLDKLLVSLKSLHSVTPTGYPPIHLNYSNKIRSRYNSNLNFYSQNPEAKSIYIRLAHHLDSYNQGIAGMIHGDPVFTNVFQTKTEIKFIDMRGRLGEELSIYGDIYYDFAKVYQSLLGYDFIINDAELDNVYCDKLIKHFESRFLFEELNNIKLITASLFFTLIPLHSYSEERINKYFKIIKNLLNDYTNSNSKQHSC
jgi:capsule biosynthesis phosphatase